LSPATAGAAAGGVPPGARRAAPLLALAAVLLGAGLLWVPKAEVVLMNDMLGYAAQGRSLLAGEGNVVRLGETSIPGYYPAGLPLGVAGALAVLGDDMRHAQVPVWVATLALLALVAWLAWRVGGPWAAPTAVLALLSSTALRHAATLTLSQVPTAALMLLCALLFLAPGARAPLFLAGLLASASLLLRYANASFPAALGLAGLLTCRGRDAPPWRTLLVLGAGLAAGGALVALHNAWAYGGALSTGYAAWGHQVEGQFSLRNILFPVMIGNRGDESLMLRSVFGLGELHGPALLLAAAWGLVVLWRAGGTARRLALLALVTVAAQDLFLACYAFRSESYLVPALPLMVVVAATGAVDLARRVAAGRGAPLAVAGAAIVLALGLRTGIAPRGPSEQEAIARHDSLARAGRELPADAALVTPSDFALVEPLVRTPGRRILYAGPFVSEVVEAAAMREVGGGPYWPSKVVPWIEKRLAEGRPVYVDQNPPPRGVAASHKKLRTDILQHYRLEAAGIEGLYLVQPRD
jgi:hypothetical protein